MSLAPVGESERIQSLDVMRGFAVLGILIVNAPFFAAPWQTAVNPILPPLEVTPQTFWSWFVMHVFFEYKCITLFSMLFGASIYLVGGERSDQARSALLNRRLSWLLVIGLIHATLIWYGDILVTYALTGFLVSQARSWRAHSLLIAGVCLLSAMLAFVALITSTFPALPADALAEMKARIWAPTDETIAAQVAAYQGGLIGATVENAASWANFIANSLPWLVVRAAGVMMIGMALFKWGFFSAKAPAWIYGVFLAIGAAAFGLIAWRASINAAHGFAFMYMQTIGTFANSALAIFGSLFYASLFSLMVKAGTFGFIATALAAVGRMAFTNYLTQSLIMTTIFWGGRGFGLYGEVDRPTLWVIVAAVWAAQLIWSPLWLLRFKMGPLEWVWRRLTYGRAMKIAKGSANA